MKKKTSKKCTQWYLSSSKIDMEKIISSRAVAARSLPTNNEKLVTLLTIERAHKWIISVIIKVILVATLVYSSERSETVHPASVAENELFLRVPRYSKRFCCLTVKL
jgi:hypothetical protein